MRCHCMRFPSNKRTRSKLNNRIWSFAIFFFNARIPGWVSRFDMSHACMQCYNLVINILFCKAELPIHNIRQISANLSFSSHMRVLEPSHTSAAFFHYIFCGEIFFCLYFRIYPSFSHVYPLAISPFSFSSGSFELFLLWLSLSQCPVDGKEGLSIVSNYARGRSS